MSSEESVTINGVTYAVQDLSDEAKNQIGNIRVVDIEIAHLQRQQAIAQTARNAYVAALIAAVPAAKGMEQ